MVLLQKNYACPKRQRQLFGLKTSFSNTVPCASVLRTVTFVLIRIFFCFIGKVKCNNRSTNCPEISHETWQNRYWNLWFIQKELHLFLRGLKVFNMTGKTLKIIHARVVLQQSKTDDNIAKIDNSARSDCRLRTPAFAEWMGTVHFIMTDSLCQYGV